MNALKRLGWLAAAVLLAGCGSKNPSDYMPSSAIYIGMNGSTLGKQAGFAPLFAMAQAMGGGASGSPDDLQEVVVGIASFSAKPEVYGYIKTAPGKLKGLDAEMKKMGLSESKLEGMTAYAAPTGNGYLVHLSDSAALICNDATALRKMKDTAKKKNPSASDAQTFQVLNELTSNHAVAVAINTEPLLALAGPQIGMVQALDQEGFAALKEVKTATLTFDYNDSMKLEATLRTAPDKADALAKLVNMGLGMAKAQAGQALRGQPGADSIQKLNAEKSDKGVRVVLEIPQEQASEMMSAMSGMASMAAMMGPAALSGMGGMPGGMGSMPGMGAMPGAGSPSPGMPPAEAAPSSQPAPATGAPGAVAPGTAPGAMPPGAAPSGATPIPQAKDFATPTPPPGGSTWIAPRGDLPKVKTPAPFTPAP